MTGTRNFFCYFLAFNFVIVVERVFVSKEIFAWLRFAINQLRKNYDPALP